VLAKFSTMPNPGMMRLENIQKVEAVNEKKLPCWKDALNKIKALSLDYGRSVAETIDLVKDINYAATGKHKNIFIATTLWIFALFAILYTSF